jgi:hypothetical protein
MAENEEKKIIIDEDWKVKAQKEKEVLKKEEEVEHQAEEEQQTQPALPEADFSGLVSMLATQAYYALGLLQAEEGAQPEPNFDIAKYNIDMLAVIQEKTKGNITDEEAKLMEGTLHQIRMVFVQISQQAG